MLEPSPIRASPRSIFTQPVLSPITTSGSLTPSLLILALCGVVSSKAIPKSHLCTDSATKLLAKSE